MEWPRPEDADGFRAAWDAARDRWTETITRARNLPEQLLDERVHGEWSFVETLRHLVFVTDSWVSRGQLGVRSPHHRLGLPPTGMTAVKGLDLGARPRLDDVLSLRADRDLARLIPRG